MAGRSSAIRPIQATLRSESVQVSLKARPSRLAAHGGFVVLVGVERGIQVDEVNALGVHTPEDVQQQRR